MSAEAQIRMKHDPQLPPSFLLLQQEGFLISSCLAAGLTELRNANVYNKGAFYSALFNLSVGTERLLKATVIIEHMLRTSLAVPSKKQLKEYGHNIVELYDTAELIAGSRNVALPRRESLDRINQEILELLSAFARTSRYYNLDALSASHTEKDPLSHWGEIIVAILSHDVPERQRTRILEQANLAAKAIDDISITLMHGLDQRPLSTEDALALPGLHDQAVKHAVLRLITILSPVRELLASLSVGAYGLGLSVPPFPQMHEFLQWMWNDREYVLRKKKWP
ncbi:MAG: hypothetical protein AB1810_09740 [Pseudomonadota bacterium]